MTIDGGARARRWGGTTPRYRRMGIGTVAIRGRYIFLFALISSLGKVFLNMYIRGPFRLLACLLGVEMEASQEVGMAYVAASYSCFLSVPCQLRQTFQRRHPILAFAKNGSAF